MLKIDIGQNLCPMLNGFTFASRDAGQVLPSLPNVDRARLCRREPRSDLFQFTTHKQSAKETNMPKRAFEWSLRPKKEGSDRINRCRLIRWFLLANGLGVRDRHVSLTPLSVANGFGDRMQPESIGRRMQSLSGSQTALEPNARCQCRGERAKHHLHFAHRPKFARHFSTNLAEHCIHVYMCVCVRLCRE